jgi:hypothetical protein
MPSQVAAVNEVSASFWDPDLAEPLQRSSVLHVVEDGKNTGDGVAMKLSSKDFHTLLRAADVAEAQVELIQSVKARSQGRIMTRRLIVPALAAVTISAALVFSVLELFVGSETPTTYVSELPSLPSSSLEG